MTQYKAYIQSVNGIPIDDWAYTAYQGFKNRGTNIILFENIEEVPVSRYNFVIAFIEDTVKYLAKMGIDAKRGLNIPEELYPFAGRQIKVMTMDEFIREEPVPVFVKPHTEVKQFPAGVITKMEYKQMFLGEYDKDTLVQTSSLIDIAAEYRGFVLNKELISLNMYMGDLHYYPDVSIIEKAIDAFKNQPVGYTIDFCVTRDNRTLLIECNDGWSIGSYGCLPNIYVRLLVARWMEMLKGAK